MTPGANTEKLSVWLDLLLSYSTWPALSGYIHNCETHIPDMKIAAWYVIDTNKVIHVKKPLMWWINTRPVSSKLRHDLQQFSSEFT